VTAAVVAEGLAIVVLAALVFNLLRTQAQVLQRLGSGGGGAPASGPVLPDRASRVGGEAANIRGTDPAGLATAVEVDGEELLVATFLTSSCSTCQELWAALAVGETSRLPDTARLVVVVPGAGLESRRRVAELAPPGVEVVMSADAWADYGVTGAPFAVVVRHGRIGAEGPVGSWGDLLSLTGPG
jgi:hypothetical protein